MRQLLLPAVPVGELRFSYFRFVFILALSVRIWYIEELEFDQHLYITQKMIFVYCAVL